MNERFRDSYYQKKYRIKNDEQEMLLHNTLEKLIHNKTLLVSIKKIIKETLGYIKKIDINELLNQLELLGNKYNKEYKFMHSNEIIKLIIEMSLKLFLINKIKNKNKRVQINNINKNSSSIKNKVIMILIYYGMFENIFIEKKIKNYMFLIELGNGIGFHLPLGKKLIFHLEKLIKEKYIGSFKRNLHFLNINNDINY